MGAKGRARTSPSRTPSVICVKYPSTPYWPHSPAIGRGERVHSSPGSFVGRPVVATEKLDGANTLIHEGEVYARSISAPSAAKWMAMVKKHHAWKVREPDIHLYGENIYPVHSIEYDPVPEPETFYAFALRHGDGTFASFGDLEAYAATKGIPTVPVLYRGRFDTVEQIREFLDASHRQPSSLGGAREGVVLRLEAEFPESKFAENVCKSVRQGHVQHDEHWTRNWRPCAIA